MTVNFGFGQISPDSSAYTIKKQIEFKQKRRNFNNTTFLWLNKLQFISKKAAFKVDS